MAGPVSITPPPGARTAAKRREAWHAKRLLDQGHWTTLEPRALCDTRTQAHARARTFIRALTTHTTLEPHQLHRRVWQVSSGPHTGRWRWAVQRIDISSRVA